MSTSPPLVKLFYRIGEVATLVGVQPHVLRYWETEFRTIRPQKSSKGQRVYSRRDVEKLLRVKDLLKNQGFTIAGARRRLREPGASVSALEETPGTGPATLAEPAGADAAPAVAAAEELEPRPLAVPALRRLAPAVDGAQQVSSGAAPGVAPGAEPAAERRLAAERDLALARAERAQRGLAVARDERARLREALTAIREDIVSMLADAPRSPPRRPRLPTRG